MILARSTYRDSAWVQKRALRTLPLCIVHFLAGVRARDAKNRRYYYEVPVFFNFVPLSPAMARLKGVRSTNKIFVIHEAPFPDVYGKEMRKYFRSFSNMLGQVVEGETDPGMDRALNGCRSSLRNANIITN